MTKVDTCYSEIVYEVTKEVGEQLRSEEKLKRLPGNINPFKSLLVETFREHCDSGMYTLRCCLPDHMVEDMRRFATLSVLDSVSYMSNLTSLLSRLIEEHCKGVEKE